MENQRVKSWIEDAERWYSLAEAANNAKFYDKSLYCLEMSMESSLKAILTGSGIEFPKSHNVTHLLIANKESFPRGIRALVDGIVDVFSALLELRNASGYRAESSLTDKDFKGKVDVYMLKVHELGNKISSVLK